MKAVLKGLAITILALGIASGCAKSSKPQAINNVAAPPSFRFVDDRLSNRFLTPGPARPQLDWQLEFADWRLRDLELLTSGSLVCDFHYVGERQGDFTTSEDSGQPRIRYSLVSAEGKLIREETSSSTLVGDIVATPEGGYIQLTSDGGLAELGETLKKLGESLGGGKMDLPSSPHVKKLLKGFDSSGLKLWETELADGINTIHGFDHSGRALLTTQDDSLEDISETKDKDGLFTSSLKVSTPGTSGGINDLLDKEMDGFLRPCWVNSDGLLYVGPYKRMFSTLECFDLKGKKLWAKKLDEGWHQSYDSMPCHDSSGNSFWMLMRHPDSKPPTDFDSGNIRESMKGLMGDLMKREFMLLALDSKGSELWKWNGGEALPMACTQDGRIVLTLNKLKYSSGDGLLGDLSRSSSLLCLGKDGRELWKFKLRKEEAVESLCLDSEGAAYISTSKQRLLCIDSLGRQRWEYKVEEPFSGPIMIGAQSQLYFFAGDSLFAIGNEASI